MPGQQSPSLSVESLHTGSYRASAQIGSIQTSARIGLTAGKWPARYQPE
jgi:hypothetical protein